MGASPYSSADVPVLGPDPGRSDLTSVTPRPVALGRGVTDGVDALIAWPARVSAAPARLAQELAEFAVGLRAARVAADLAALCPTVDEAREAVPVIRRVRGACGGHGSARGDSRQREGDDGLQPHASHSFCSGHCHCSDGYGYSPHDPSLDGLGPPNHPTVSDPTSARRQIPQRCYTATSCALY